MEKFRRYLFRHPPRKAELSVFPPVAENGRFPPVIVVDIQAKPPPGGLGPAVRGSVVRTATSTVQTPDEITLSSVLGEWAPKPRPQLGRGSIE